MIGTALNKDSTGPFLGDSVSVNMHRQRILLGVVCLGVGFRLAVLLVYLVTHGWHGETWEYEAIAGNLLAGKGFTYEFNETTYQSYAVPVFPLVCAFLHLMGGSGLGLYYVFHLAASAGIIVLTYAIASRSFGHRIGLLSAVLVALEPGLVIYQSYKVDVMALAGVLLLLGVLAFFRLVDSFDDRWALGLGVVLGIGILTRPDLVALGGLLLVWLVWQRRQAKPILRVSAIAIVVAMLIVAPWSMRNYRVHGQFVLLTTVTGEWLWRGNNLNATGTSLTADGRSQLEAAPAAFRERIFAANELQQNALLTEEAVRFIRDDPAAFLARAAKRFWYFWWFTPTFGLSRYEWVPDLGRVAYRLGYGVILGMAGWGFVRARGMKGAPASRAAVYLLVVPVCIALVHSMNYVEGRHRVLVMPLLLILAAQGMVGVVDRVRQSRAALPSSRNSEDPSVHLRSPHAPSRCIKGGLSAPRKSSPRIVP